VIALPDAEARAVALDLRRHVLLVAPAGSGKTGLLVQRMLAALAEVEQPEQVLAITFTNKAAAEIRHRVLQALVEADQPPPEEAFGQQRHRLALAARAQDRRLGWGLLEDPQRLRALTIDGLNASIAHELPLFSGLGGRSRPSEQSRGLTEAAVLALFDRALGEDADPELHAAAQTLLAAAQNRLDTLLPALSRLLERREQWSPALLAGDDDAHADALLQRLHQAARVRLRDALGTDLAALLALARGGADHSEALHWARGLETWPEDETTAVPIVHGLAGLLVTQDGRLRSPKGINARMGLPAGVPARAALQAWLSARGDDEALAAAAAAVRQLPPARLPAALKPLRSALQRLLRQALAELRLEMSARGETDFTEVALAALQALHPDGGYGEALLRRDAQVRHLLVDEMQDTSPAQVQLLERLTEGWQPGDGRSLFLVGDPQQSIYAFRKADVRVFLRLLDTRRLGELALDCRWLRANFRSDPQLVDWINQGLGPRFPTRPDADIGAVGFTPALAQRPAAAATVTLAGFEDPLAEAAAAATAAEAALCHHHSVAVLARTRRQLAPLIAELRARGVAYRCVEIDALAGQPAVRDLLACFRACWHAADHLSWLLWLRAPWVGLSWQALVQLSVGRRRQPWRQRLAEADTAPLDDEDRRRLVRLREALAAVEGDPALASDLLAAVETLWHRLDGAAAVPADAVDDVARAQALIREHARGGQLQDPEAFERAVAALYAQPSEGRLELMTLHRAKGLEFDAVLLVGAGHAPRNDPGELLELIETPTDPPLVVPQPPTATGTDPDPEWATLYDYALQRNRASRRAEGLRLLYVGLTRARQSLQVFASGRTDEDGRLRVPEASLAGLLGAELRLPADAPVAPRPPVDRQRPPLAPRLPLPTETAEARALARGWPVPQERRAWRPSEQLLAPEAAEVDEDVYAQALGTLFHEAMAALCAGATWEGEAPARTQALKASLRRSGFAEPEVARGSARVLELVARVRASATGRALIGHWPWAASEYALAGYGDGQWISAVIDRCFEDGEGRLWVVDYKISARGIDPGAADAYAEDSRRRYAAQVEGYARLMAAHRPQARAVIPALYLVETDALLAPDGTRLSLPPSPPSG
jgi:ATP-dependent helicase/nuclease subunit A